METTRRVKHCSSRLRKPKAGERDGFRKGNAEKISVMYSFEEVLKMAGIRPVKQSSMTWTEFEERYDESKEDHAYIDEEEDDRQECTMCGNVFPPEELSLLKRERHNENLCKECLAEIGKVVEEALS